MRANTIRRTALVCAMLCGIACWGCAGTGAFGHDATSLPATQAAAQDPAQADAWKQIADALGKPGEARDGVYTVTFPRDDLSVTIEGMDVPTAAGLASTFHFYRCSCGKTVVLGQFVVADYEANDVAYALQKEDFLICTMAPLLVYEKPRLMQVRFQAEGQPRPLAQALRTALDWTGRNRMAAPKKLAP